MEDKNREGTLSPAEYFADIKQRKHTVTEAELKRIHENCLELFAKYQITGQKTGMRKLMFHLQCIEKERELVKMGIDTFVYKGDVERYIDDIAKDVVKIIDIEHYEREIPDEIVEVVQTTKPLFDQLYIVYTDYTGKEERRVESERRDKDPILFGVFLSEESRCVVDRFYFLGDWEDEFCSLTLDRMVSETKHVGKRDILRHVQIPQSVDDVRAQLAVLEENRGNEGASFIAAGDAKLNQTKPLWRRVLTYLTKAKQK